MLRRSFIVGVLSVVGCLTFLTGCNKPTVEQLLADATVNVDKLGDILKTVKDESSAKAAVEQFKSVGEAMKKIDRSASSLSAAQIKDFTEKVSQMTRKNPGFVKELTRIAQDPNPKLVTIIMDGLKKNIAMQ